jgi:hypothetical protein
MGINQNTRSHRRKIIFREIKIICHPSEASQVLLPELSFFDRKTSEALGTHHLRATVTMTTVFYIFLGFIRGFRKYEKIFTHEYYIPHWRYPRGIWYSWVNQFSYFSHQHAINVYCYIDRCELWGCIHEINFGISHVKYQFFPTGTTFT